jgi:tRNA (guanine-N7-)-methyltransferase
MSRKLQADPALIVDPDALEGPIDFLSVFGRPGPVHIEIGSGRGTFLVSQAAAFPEDNFLGVEWAAKFYRISVDRIARRGLSNVRLLRTEAAGFVARYIPDGSVRMFHIYFPDPWPKRRHNRRRFLSEPNLPHLLRCLETGGMINFATDHEDYYLAACRIADKGSAEGVLHRIDFIRPAGARDGELVGTNYERKYKVEGRPTYTLALQKK